jgi:hypothetical protein
MCGSSAFLTRPSRARGDVLGAGGNLELRSGEVQNGAPEAPGAIAFDSMSGPNATMCV